MVLNNMGMLVFSILSIVLFAVSIISINCGEYLLGVVCLVLGSAVYLMTFQSILDDGDKRRKSR